MFTSFLNEEKQLKGRQKKKTSSGECHSIEFYITDHNSDHSDSKWNFGPQKDISLTAAHW